MSFKKNITLTTEQHNFITNNEVLTGVKSYKFISKAIDLYIEDVKYHAEILRLRREKQQNEINNLIK